MFSTLFWFFIAVIAIAGIAFVGFVVWIGERTKERKALYRSETVKKIAESAAAEKTQPNKQKPSLTN